MKLLLDEALSQRLAPILQAAGHDCIHIRDLGLQGRPDNEIMTAAVADSRVLVSLDTDFGELLALGQQAGPSVLLLRRAPHSPALQAPLVLAALAAVEQDLIAGAIAVIVGDHIRIRSLPIGD